MRCDLVERWIVAVKPFSFAEVKGKYIDAYSMQVGLPPDIKEKVLQAINNVSEDSVNAKLKMFAEENFSDETLLPAVEFFESKAGQDYLKQREVVINSCMAMLGKMMGDAANAAGL